ncbi:aspartate/glutamate racemase family protein [Pseudarthrobacter sp. J47]|uniref:aspartate/glutamate racemase family protein n=1 Tax=Pseudarthrobacter sp. J47 TaxID=3116482 RepID=UPI002E7FF402|nr:aspartate/glutamate racemase family protein [Pseudarthrobacter sp. J47]MEE2523286.1 aspartate/glutamate racemase family protein [Pseudarthrobacter sp. J47]
MGTDQTFDGGTQAAASRRRAVLLINPNTNKATTALMTGLAREVLQPRGFGVVGLTAAAGPAMITDPDALAESAIHVQLAARHYLDGPDGGDVAAVIVAAIGDPGRAELEKDLDVPVVGIGQASVLAAAADGRRFGMATSTPLLADALGKLVATHGKAGLFTGVRLTPSEPLVLAADPEQQFHELAAAVQESVDDGAQAVIIAGGPLSETARRLAQVSTARIIEPIPSACGRVLELLAVAVPGD